MLSNEFVRHACERALTLSSVVEADGLRQIAFGEILSKLLIVPPADGRTPKPPEAIAKQLNKKPAAGQRPNGLKARLLNLQQEGFFVNSRDAAQVAVELKALGWNHSTTEISARLTDLSRERVVRRSPKPGGRKGTYVYSNW